MQLQRVCHDTLDCIQVPGFPSAIETHSLPTLTRSYPRRFTFYVAWPAAPFARLTHSRRNVVPTLAVAYDVFFPRKHPSGFPSMSLVSQLLHSRWLHSLSR